MGSAARSRRSVDAHEFAELVLSGQAEVPISVEDSVLASAAKFERVSAFCNREIVGGSPAIVDEALTLPALVRTELNWSESLDLHINIDIRSCVGRFSFNKSVVVAVVRDRKFVDDTRVEGMCLN